MNECDVVRDLLPLYADDVCSPASRTLVETHVRDCPACKSLLDHLRDGRIEQDLETEKTDVIRYGAVRLRRRSAAVGSLIAGLMMIPLLICLVVNIASGGPLNWFLIVLAAMTVVAALVITPLTVAEDRLFWTFSAFTASLVLLLAVVSLLTGGGWFWIAASASLFGLAAIFLPFAIKAQPVRRLIGSASRAVIVLALDAALFVNMMNMIAASRGFTFRNFLLLVGSLAGIGLAVLEIKLHGGKQS